MKFTIIVIFALVSVGCSNSSRPVSQNTNSSVVASTPDRSQTAIAHSSENQTPPSAPTTGKSKWTASGDPIDTTALDSAVASAEKTVSAKPADTAAKKALGEAFYKRAVALTEARQYASALGDYRRALKNDPSKAEAKEWIEKIIMIYDGLGKESPKEGEEPPPLPFGKTK